MLKGLSVDVDVLDTLQPLTTSVESGFLIVEAIAGPQAPSAILVREIGAGLGAGVEVGSASFVALSKGAVRAQLSLASIRSVQSPIRLQVDVLGGAQMERKAVLCEIGDLLAGAGNRIDTVRLVGASANYITFEAVVHRFCGLPLQIELLVNGARVGRAESAIAEYQPDVGEDRAVHSIEISSARAILPGDRVTLVNCFERRKIVFEGQIGGAHGKLDDTQLNPDIEAMTNRLGSLEAQLSNLQSEMARQTGSNFVRALNERLDIVHHLLSEKLDKTLRQLLSADVAAPVRAQFQNNPSSPTLRSLPLEIVDGVGLSPIERAGQHDVRWLDRWVTIILRDIEGAKRMRLLLDEVEPHTLNEVVVSVDGLQVAVEIIKGSIEGQFWLSLNLAEAKWAGSVALISMVFPSHRLVTKSQQQPVACRLCKVEVL